MEVAISLRQQKFLCFILPYVLALVLCLTVSLDLKRREVQPLMNNRLIRTILLYSALGLAFALYSRPAQSVTIGSETPDTLSFNFNDIDAYPSGNSPFSDSPLVTLYDGQYWQVSAQSLSAPTGPAVGRSKLFVRQVVPGQDVLPGAVFSLSLRDFLPSTQQISYLSNSSAANFNNTNCSLGSTSCVFYDLQAFTTIRDPEIPSPSLRYELKGFFQSPDPPTPVPESSTIVGSLAALGLIAVLQIKRRFA